MKYKKCPRCQLNYLMGNATFCSVCQDEIKGKKSIFDLQNIDCLLCPYCNKRQMGIDDIMCEQCLLARNKNYHET